MISHKTLVSIASHPFFDTAWIFLQGQRGHFAPPENGFAPLNYASVIKLILI